MKRGFRNVYLLATSQALTQSAMILSMTLGAIVGSSLAANKGLATLPIALMVVGTTLASLPAALFMQRHGRRLGFLLGSLLGISGSLLSAWALYCGSFAGFTGGHFLLGLYQGFANYYRFAAAEAAPDHQHSKAISLVVAGGLAAAFIGPQLGLIGRDWLAPYFFVGSYLAQAVLGLLALGVLSRLSLPRAVRHVATTGARPVRQVLAQPSLQIAIVGSAVGFAIMVMLMSATPLAMVGCGLARGDVVPVIQWHVFSMFAPSLVTGRLIGRWGALRMMQTGLVLLLLQVIVSLSGVSFGHFLVSLILLGLGWNFAFIGGTSLLTQSYRASEQLKVQAINESCIYGLVAVATLSAGWLYDQFGWEVLNYAVAPVIAATLILTWLRKADPGREPHTNGPALE